MPLIRNGEQQTRFSTGRRCRQPSQICSWQQRDSEVTAKSKDQLSSPYRQSIRQPQWQAESQAFDIIGGKLIPGWGGQPNRINTKNKPQKGVSYSKIWEQTSGNTKHKTTDKRLLISATIWWLTWKFAHRQSGAQQRTCSALHFPLHRHCAFSESSCLQHAETNVSTTVTARLSPC